MGELKVDNGSDVTRSKRLARLLRHQPELVGLDLDRNGWVDVGALLDALADHGNEMSRDDLRRVVERNDKQRFEWDATSDRIRARQGHSVEVDLGLEATTPPDLLFHGTPKRRVDSIRASGIDRGSRHHVHLSHNIRTARTVGARRGDAVALSIDAGAMAHEGHEFFVTANGVWLTHFVPARFVHFPA